MILAWQNKNRKLSYEPILQIKYYANALQSLPAYLFLTNVPTQHLFLQK